MFIKRIFDIFCSAVGLIFLMPLLLLIAVAIKIDSRGPVFFLQTRVGRAQRPFSIHKFRTMRSDAGTGKIQITVGNDARITRVGRILRKTKLDELPQLIDVLVGDMSLVGPRPEVPKYVEHYPEEARARIFSVRPGITDYSSIYFRSESELLAEADDPEKYYIQEIIPKKIEFYLLYVNNPKLSEDIKIILLTARALFR